MLNTPVKMVETVIESSLQVIHAGNPRSANDDVLSNNKESRS